MTLLTLLVVLGALVLLVKRYGQRLKETCDLITGLPLHGRPRQNRRYDDALQMVAAGAGRAGAAGDVSAAGKATKAPGKEFPGAFLRGKHYGEPAFEKIALTLRHFVYIV